MKYIDRYYIIKDEKGNLTFQPFKKAGLIYLIESEAQEEKVRLGLKLWVLSALVIIFMGAAIFFRLVDTVYLSPILGLWSVGHLLFPRYIGRGLKVVGGAKTPRESFRATFIHLPAWRWRLFSVFFFAMILMFSVMTFFAFKEMLGSEYSLDNIGGALIGAVFTFLLVMFYVYAFKARQKK